MNEVEMERRIAEKIYRQKTKSKPLISRFKGAESGHSKSLIFDLTV
jgi:hypothetical protein